MIQFLVKTFSPNFFFIVCAKVNHRLQSLLHQSSPTFSEILFVTILLITCVVTLNMINQYVDVQLYMDKTLYNYPCIVISCRDGSTGTNLEQQFNIEPDVHELYIELLCKYQPSWVYAYIRVADGYRLEQTLEVCINTDIKSQTQNVFILLGRIYSYAVTDETTDEF